MFLYVCVCVFLASFVSILSPDSLHHPLKVYTCVESCSTVYFTHTKLRGRPTVNHEKSISIKAISYDLAKSPQNPVS